MVYWYGLALSGFGIVYNNDVLRAKGVDASERLGGIV